MTDAPHSAGAEGASPLLSYRADGAQWAWDSTSIKTLAECPRKYYYSLLQGWTSELRSVHLIFGGHYASALERFHKLRAAGQSFDDAQRTVVRELLIATWDSEAGAPQDWFHSTKTRDTLLRSVVWYLEHYRDDQMETVILSDGRAAVEYSFTLELSPSYVYCGHIDRLVTYGGDTYVQDQKTTGSTITPRYFEGYSPDYQMTGYTLAGSAIFQMPVKGVIIDAAQIAVGFTAFARQPVLRHPTQLEEFCTEILHYIQQAETYHDSGYWPMNRTACGNYGGCEFRRICSALPVHREALLSANFRKRDRWDPLAKR